MGRERRGTIATALTVAALASACSLCAAAKPNILLFLVDDLGYNDLSMQGSTDVKSPNIDRLCTAGVNFTECYSVAGFCSPARAGLLGGIHPWHFGHVYNPAHDLKDITAGMPLHITTVVETLRAAGYATMATGKWHLGFHEAFFPMKRGFDRFFGFLGGRFNYFQSTTSGSDGRDQYIYDDYKIFDDVTYATDDWAEKSMEFMEQSKEAGKPFFIYHSINAPHGPFEAKEEDKDPNIQPADRQSYVAMIKSIDDSLGRMRKKIKDLGLQRETLILFTNDNGGKEEVSVNLPLRDYKGSAYDGGVRVAFCMTWPKTIKWKQTFTQVVSLLDIYPTLQAVAEVAEEDKNPDLQGVNLMPFIIPAGKNKPANKGTPREFVHGLRGAKHAMVRYGPWKLHVFREADGAPWFLENEGTVLYNLDEDIGETIDRIGDEGSMEIAQTMMDDFLLWYDKVVEPAFEPSLGGREFAENPLSVNITGYPTSIQVGVEYPFVAVGSSTENRRLYYFWEVFRREDWAFNTFNQVAKTEGNKRRKRQRKNAFITFFEPGEWIVRINLEDRVRWRQWTDLVVNVE